MVKIYCTWGFGYNSLSCVDLKKPMFGSNPALSSWLKNSLNDRSKYIMKVSEYKLKLLSQSWETYYQCQTQTTMSATVASLADALSVRHAIFGEEWLRDKPKKRLRGVYCNRCQAHKNRVQLVLNAKKKIIQSVLWASKITVGSSLTLFLTLLEVIALPKDSTTINTSFLQTLGIDHAHSKLLSQIRSCWKIKPKLLAILLFACNKRSVFLISN